MSFNKWHCDLWRPNDLGEEWTKGASGGSGGPCRSRPDLFDAYNERVKDLKAVGYDWAPRRPTRTCR